MSRTRLELKALDTLFFRDGKPFTMGQSIWANGIFPPAPSVIFGTLRAIYYASHPGAYQTFLQDLEHGQKNDPTLALKLRGLCLSYRDNDYFPAPLDLVSTNDSDQEAIDAFPLTLQAVDQSSAVSALRLRLGQGGPQAGFSRIRPGYLLSTDKKVESTEGRWIFSDHLEDYLHASCRKPFRLTNWKSQLQLEPKIGIARNRQSLSAEDGMLYRADMRRLNNLKLVAEAEGLDVADKGLTRLGGEGKGAAFAVKAAEPIAIPPPALRHLDGRRNQFKLYFSTPTVFGTHGWLPNWQWRLDVQGTLKGRFQSENDSIELTFLAAAIGRSFSIGGFDMNTRQPKTMHRLIPAGSVYYFETDAAPEQIIRAFHDRAICEDSDLEKQGYGIAYVGALP